MQAEVLDGLHGPFELLVDRDRELVKSLMQPLTEMQWECMSVYYGLNCYEEATDMQGVMRVHGEALTTLKLGGVGLEGKIVRKIKEGVVRVQPGVNALLRQIATGYTMPDIKLAWPVVKMPWEGK